MTSSGIVPSVVFARCVRGGEAELDSSLENDVELWSGRGSFSLSGLCEAMRMILFRQISSINVPVSKIQ